MNMMGTDRMQVGRSVTWGSAFRLLLVLCLSLLLVPAAGMPVAGQASGLRMRIAKDALWYTGNEKMQLEVTLDVPGEQPLDGVSITFRLYSPLANRAELAEFRTGKGRRVRESIVLGSNLRIDPGTQRLEYALDLPALDLAEGAWPYSVETSRRGEKLAERKGCLLIEKALHGEPLGVMPLWEVHYPPALDAQGSPVGWSELAAACGSEPGREGFLYSLFSAIERHPGVKTTLACSSLTLQALEDPATTASSTIREEASLESQVNSVTEVADALRRSAEEGRVSLMSSSYAYANLEQLESKGWLEDAREQVARGLEGLQAFAPSDSGRGFFPPRYALGPQTPGLLAEQGASFTIATEEDLAATPEGRALIPGVRAGYPVRLDAGEDQGLDAWVADEQIYAYLAEKGSDRTGQEVVENLLAETFLMQVDRPADKRACLISFPEDFQPDSQLLNQIYDALVVAPWVETTFPDTALAAVTIPDSRPVSLVAAPVSYPLLFDRFEETRDLTLSYRKILFEENTLKSSLYSDLLAVENADLYLEAHQPQGEQSLASLSGLVRGEMEGIQVQERGNVTLASTKGELTVVVSNLNDYPVKADLLLSDTTVIFPEGNQREVVVNPQDNRFRFNVETRRKGSFLLDIVLSGGGLELSRSTVNLRTSSLNTLALIFLAVLLGALFLAMLLRKMSHWGRRGKHEHL
jgi:hypothetical protein